MSSQTQTAGSWRHAALAFLLVLFAYASVALWQITLPGVYMDAVNPDYLVVKVLNRHAEPIGAWVLDANYVSNRRLPILIALYHGSLPFWAGLPFFWLFGTDVTGLRLTHAMFGVAVLSSAFIFLLRARVQTWVAAFGCIVLALDPAFSYAFRTQSYITLGSIAWMLWGAAALLHARDPATLHRSRWWLAAGFLYGVAIFGYFVHAFFFPALLFAVVLRGGTAWAERVRGLMLWGTGLAAGLVGYWIGYGLIIRARHGLRGFIAFVQEQQSTLGVFNARQTLTERIANAWGHIQGILDNGWHQSLMFGAIDPAPGAALKPWLLVLLPLVLFLAVAVRRRASGALWLAIALIGSFVAVSLIFGSRLGGHHFVVLLPLLYLALALGLHDVIQDMPPGPVRTWTIAVPLIVLASANIAGQIHDGATLARTRGVGLYSDAINRFAADLDGDPRKLFVYLPDWGLSMPVAFLTRGRVGMDTVANTQSARFRLCHGQNVGVALVGPDRDARFAKWQADLRWSPPLRTPYAQADGTTVFELGVFMADRNAPECTGGK